MRRGQPLRWAILGPGEIARVFAQSQRRSGAGVVVAVAGGGAGRAEAFARECGGVPSDVDAALGADVDAVYVATPHSAHAELVHRALAAGRAVLCEKPLTPGPTETIELIEHARRANVPLVEGWMYRAHPQITRALALAASGEIGRVRSLEACFGFEAPFDARHRLFDPALAGGAILDVGGYPVSLAIATARAVGGGDARGFELTQAEGELASTGVDALARATLRFASGLRARVACATVRDWGQRATLHGDHGVIHLETAFLPGGERLGTRARIRVETAAGAREELVEAEHDCFTLETQALAELLEARAAGSPAVELAEPLVGHAESILISRSLDVWRRELGAR